MQIMKLYPISNSEVRYRSCFFPSKNNYSLIKSNVSIMVRTHAKSSNGRVQYLLLFQLDRK